MKKRTWFIVGASISVIAAIIIVVVLSLPGKSLRATAFAPAQVSPGYQQYVLAFTSGIISSHSRILVVLTDDYLDSTLFASMKKEKLFSLKPQVPGNVILVNNHTLAFCPDEPLKPGASYTTTFHLNKLIHVPDSLKNFVFSFQVTPQDLQVEILNHKAVSAADLSREILTGVVRTADEAPATEVEKSVTITQNGDHLPLTWNHDPQRNRHYFQTDSVSRTNREGSVTVSWDGSPIGASVEGEKEIVIPSLDSFVVLDARMVEGMESCIVVRFSDPLSKNRNLAGLIRIGDQHDFRYTIEDNALMLYPAELNGDSVKVTLDAGIRNAADKPLGMAWSAKIPVLMARPEVRFTGDGVIMPSSSRLLFPFEAIHLRAVDITVIRIFAQNILQFLQNNELDGAGELVSVGRVVLKKSIPLNGVLNYGVWNHYAIDLSELIAREPGAIYTVRLSMRQAYSTFPCSDQGDSGESREDPLTVLFDPDSLNNESWSYYSSYQEWDYDGYEWEDRENPCKPTYYMNKSISRNVLASDLGLMAKRGSDEELHIYVTNLITAHPEPGVRVELYNFQQQKLAEVVTDAEGIATFHRTYIPAFVVARKDNQSAYLKLVNGRSLSLSMFDVGGEVVEKGIKGFLYGERGVWRPGDSIHLSFILSDADGSLPDNHPVSLSLIDPRGQLAARLVRTSSVNNIYSFPLMTSHGALTGNWLAKVTVGGATFTKTIRIETVKPNRLKIRLEVPGDKLAAGKIPQLTMNVNWLTGPVAANLKTTVTLSLTREKTSFSGFPGYLFSYPFSDFAPENIQAFSGKLNDQGEASFKPDIRLTHAAPGMLKASFETMVFEEGGDFSVDRFTVPYSPFASYAGLAVPEPTRGNYVLFTNKPYAVSLLNVTADGVMVPSSQLRVEVFRLDWRWWWDDTESDYSASFIGNQSQRLVDSQVVDLSKGRGTYTLNIDDDDWGRYLIRVTDLVSGHMSGKVVYMDWAGYFRMPGGEKQAAAMLTFTSDKPVYKTGDKVKLSIPSAEGGRALITLEDGTRIIQSFWTPTKNGTTDVVFTVTAGMSPTVYAYVTLLQPYAQTVNDLPVRLYGVIPIQVEDPASHLKPEIRVADVLVPGKEATIAVSEGNKRAMTYTLAVVDEGLLDLTRFKTPDPWSHFNAREALGVKTWDMYDMVLGAATGELQRILSIGGDEEALMKGNLKANRFDPMVKFLGTFTLKKGETKKHTFLMPEYIGSVRVMVVAADDNAFGSSEKQVFVRKPLMVKGALPRVLGPGETVSLPVTVFAMENDIREVTVNLTTSDLFTVSGEQKQRLSFTATGEQVAIFTLQVKEGTGTGTVTMEAVSGNHTARETIEIDIRNPNPPVSQVIAKAIQPGAVWGTPFTACGIPGTNSGSLELSVMPPMNLEQRLRYLVRYPYGCLEQLVSGAFPQLYLDNLMELSPSRKEQIGQHVTSVIRQIHAFQVTGGAFAMWSGSLYPNDWVTSYTGHFLLEATRKGYAVSPELLSGWKRAQRQKAVIWDQSRSSSNSDVTQAYRLFTLSLAGIPELSAMNKLREWTGLTNTARWLLAGAYQLAGKPEVASALANVASPEPTSSFVADETFGSDLRDKALMAEVLCLMNRQTTATPLVHQLAEALSADVWYSTQTTAFALMAIAQYAGKLEQTGISATVKFNRGESTSIESALSMQVLPLDNLNAQPAGSVEVKNSGKEILFARLLLTGTPPPGKEEAAAHNLTISTGWRDMNGTLLDISRLEQGTTFFVLITVTGQGIPGKVEHLALSQIIPSGWEIINARMSSMAEVIQTSSTFDYQYVGDDRVNTFFSLSPGETKKFAIMLTAAYLGRFYLPATSCEAMYDHSCYARTPGRWVQVID